MTNLLLFLLIKIRSFERKLIAESFFENKKLKIYIYFSFLLLKYKNNMYNVSVCYIRVHIRT